MNKLIKKDYRYLVRRYDDLFGLQVKLLDLEEEGIIGNCIPILKRIERVRDDLDKITKKIKKDKLGV